MSMKKSLIGGRTFIFFIIIVFLLTNIFYFSKKSLKFQIFKFFSLIFTFYNKSLKKSLIFCRNFPTFRRSTTSLLITGGVGGTWVNSPSCKMATFFSRSLALSLLIYRNFQSNEAKWRNFKLKDYTIPLFME